MSGAAEIARELGMAHGYFRTLQDRMTAHEISVKVPHSLSGQC